MNIANYFFFVQFFGIFKIVSIFFKIQIMFATWNPVASNILATATFDSTIDVWDVSRGGTLNSPVLKQGERTPISF